MAPSLSRRARDARCTRHGVVTVDRLVLALSSVDALSESQVLLLA